MLSEKSSCHHDVQQDQIWLLLSRYGKRHFPVNRRKDLIAVDSEAGPEDVEIIRVVVRDEDSRWR